MSQSHAQTAPANEHEGSSATAASRASREAAVAAAQSPTWEMWPSYNLPIHPLWIGALI